MAAVLYYGSDAKLIEISTKFFESRKADAGEVHSITQTIDDKKFQEYVTSGVVFDLIFVDSSKAVPLPGDWLGLFRKKYPSISTPIVLLGDESNAVKIMKLIETGFMDYFVLPADKALFIEKFGLYTTGKRNRDLKQVYSLSMSQPADLAKPAVIEELSEFDCKVRTGQDIPVNDLLVIYSKSFSTDAKVDGSVLGRCYHCMPHQSFKGQFLASLYFVGIRPEILKDIRNSLLKSYVASKSKN